MEHHNNYFLRRIANKDKEKPFFTATKGFDTVSKTLAEFVDMDIDCNEDGIYITYLFGQESNVYGLSRMRTMSFKDFKNEIKEQNAFDFSQLEEYSDSLVVYMSRVGIPIDLQGLGFGGMLRQFIDSHARRKYRNFLLYARVNWTMLCSMLARFGATDFTNKKLIELALKRFKKKYRISDKLWSNQYESNYWVVLREF